MIYTPEEIKGIESNLNLLVTKHNRLKAAHIIETHEARKFELEHEIAQIEAEKDDLKRILSEAFSLGCDSGQERLREKIRALNISEDMGRLHLVNCNRHELRDRFEDAFDRHTESIQHNHFYFLSACPRQMPPSLGERMIYELLGELLDEDSKSAVHCRFDAQEHDRIQLEKLPIGNSLEKSKQLFREFCAGWYGWEEKQDFEAALQGNLLPAPRYQYSILPFFTRKKEYKSFLPEYLDWMMTELGKRPAGGPTLMVFVVFYLEDLHHQFQANTNTVSDPKAAEIVTGIDQLCKKHSNSGHFYPLMPVEKSDLEDWFVDLGVRNTARLEPVFQVLAQGLPAAEAKEFMRTQLLNMNRVELVQELVYKLNY